MDLVLKFTGVTSKAKTILKFKGITYEAQSNRFVNIFDLVHLLPGRHDTFCLRGGKGVAGQHFLGGGGMGMGLLLQMCVIQHQRDRELQVDPVSTKFVLAFTDVLLPVFEKIVKLGLISGAVPRALKNSVVKPLIKKSNLDPRGPRFLPHGVKPAILVQDPVESSC